MPLLECVRLVKEYGDKLALDVDFHVEQGEIVGLVGREGAGKTTAYRLACGLLSMRHAASLTVALALAVCVAGCGRVTPPSTAHALPSSSTPSSKPLPAEFRLAHSNRLDDAKVYSNQGYVWLQKGEHDKAIADYTEAIHLVPNDATAYSNRGFAWGQKDEHDKAIADYTEVIRLNPKNASAYFGRGLAWGQKGELDKAIADYTEAIRFNPNDETAYANRGFAWLGKDEYDRAVADCTEAIRLNPQFVDAYGRRGLAWQSKGDYEKAVADFSNGIALDPKDARAYDSLAWIYATCPNAQFRDGKKAVDNASKACELTAWKDSNNIGTLAAAYADVGDFEAAVNWQEKAVELAPEKSKGELRSRLDLYKAHKPYREEVKK